MRLGVVVGGCAKSSATKWLAARMGPTVWELEGPIPILNSSKRLVFMWRRGTPSGIVGAKGVWGLGRGGARVRAG